MYKNKITQENIAKLKGLGYIFIGPREGKLVCGDVGTGCLAEVEKIIAEVKKILWFFLYLCRPIGPVVQWIEWKFPKL